MPLSGILKTLFKQESGQQPKVTSLKPGQIVHGKITKLFPNQTAEVQVGSQKLIAKLEVPLSVGARYWFQVQPGEGKLNLKLLAGTDAVESKNGDNTENLLMQLGLSATKGNIEFVSYILKEQLALPNEAIPLAADWLDNVSSRREGMETIQIMAERNLPFTQEIFVSLNSLQAKTPFHELLGATLRSLDSAPLTPTVIQLKNMLKTILASPESRIAEKSLAIILNEVINSEPNQLHAQGLLQKAGFIPAFSNNENDFSNRQTPAENGAIETVSFGKSSRPAEPEKIDVLQHAEDKLEGMQQKVQKADGFDHLKAMIADILKGTDTQSDPLLKENIHKNFTRIFTSIGLNEEQIENGFKKMAEFVRAVLNPEDYHENSLSETEKNWIEEVVKEEFANLSLTSGNEQAGKQLKSLISSLGFGFENGLFEKEFSVVLKEEKQTLKPLLIRYLNEQSNSVQKAPAENLLHRMNGMQLLSHDNGPVMQFLTQVPLTFFNHTTDLSIQWNGRKLENGKIDPNYCRVLFYLNLQSLGDTIVDMQVQNRILSLSVSSERTDLKKISAPFVVLLKTQLKDLDYHLSSISFENGVEEKIGTPMKKSKMKCYESKLYGGVDFRI
ncbi:MAG: hypothetical protein Q8906_04070 [Bacillota bacterium]|nr:hypothetical protein [Bacillota bacterium]